MDQELTKAVANQYVRLYTQDELIEMHLDARKTLGLLNPKAISIALNIYAGQHGEQLKLDL